jgi:hypothetical protein
MICKHFVSVLLITVGLQPSLHGQTRFPSTIHTSHAPAGTLSVRWVEASPSTPHQLVLEGRAGKASTLLQFDRSVVVRWSPDGQALAVTTYEGSDQATTWVFGLGQMPDSSHLDMAAVPDSVRHASCVAQSHTYLEAVKWIDNKTLQVRLRSRDQAEHDCPVHTWRHSLR